MPVVAVPHAKQELMTFPAVSQAQERLASWGVRFVHVSGDGESGPLPWTHALSTLCEPLAAAGSASVCQNR